jgi:uncharacterized protein (UPF0248 family)
VGQESMSKKKTDITLGITFFVVHIGFCASSSLMIKAEQFPIVWRYSMYLNAPNPIVTISIISAVILVIPLHILLKRTTKPMKNSKINPGIYYIDFVIIFSFITLFTQLGLIVNGAFDNTESETYIVRVTDKQIHHPKLSYTDYYIYIEDWSDAESKIQIRVDGLSRYETVKIGDSIQVVTKKGFLGYEWIVNERQIMKGTQ